MNPLSDYPKARRIAYYCSFVVGLLLGAAQVGYASSSYPQPEWLVVALAVYAFAAAALGLTAGANTPAPAAGRRILGKAAESPRTPRRTEQGAGELRTAVMLAALVVLILVILALVGVL